MNIIPLPNKYKQQFGSFTVDELTSINYSNEFKLSSDLLINYIKSKTNLNLKKSNTANINFLLNIDLPIEGYILDISENSINIHARSDHGAFYAIISLMQLMFIKNNHLSFNSYYIEDYPRFPYRGFLLDTSRHFFKKEVVFKIIDYLAFHKLNYLHLHLSDDQGFRLQIDKYPQLSKIGSVRENQAIVGNKKITVTHEGFYTKEDIKDIVDYAIKNFIEVIPEIDLPGHSSAILASYSNLSCNKKQIQVPTKTGILNNCLCASSDEVYEFIYDILDEVMEIFPNKNIHIGADEVRFKNWKKCKKCRALMKKEQLKSYKDLSRYFTNKLSSYLRDNSKTPIAWNDLINNKSNYKIILQHWKPFSKKQTVKEINNGRKAIISSFFHLYLNYPHEMIPLKKTYNFEPIFKGIEKPDNVIGIEATVWTEWIDNLNLLQEHMFPRLAAVSEVAWTNQNNKNYDDFLMRLKSLVVLYDNKSINYKTDYNKEQTRIRRFFRTVKWLNKNIRSK